MDQAEKEECQDDQQDDKLKMFNIGSAFLSIKDKMKKTPVSILQEIAAAVKTPLTYEISDEDASGLRKCRAEFQGSSG